MKNTIVYVMAYGKFKKEKLPNCYKYILCGADQIEYLNQDIKDNTYDNISSLNKYYSELTGLYWAWKNDNYSSIKGLVCYRRFLISLFPFPHYITEKSINRYLAKYDIIMSKKKGLGGLTVREQFEKGVSSENISICENIIKEKYPEYVDDMNYVWNEKKLSAFNIMICKKEVFDDYCEWLFSILFEMHSKIVLEELSGYQMRIFAFVSERLLPIWVRHNNLRIKYCVKYNTQWRKFLFLKLKHKTEK